jgi:hypothetical protein
MTQTKTIRIYDKATGFLQFAGDERTPNPQAAWVVFREDLGYQADEPGVCEASAYVWTYKEDIEDTSECEDF